MHFLAKVKASCRKDDHLHSMQISNMRCWKNDKQGQAGLRHQRNQINQKRYVLGNIPLTCSIGALYLDKFNSKAYLVRASTISPVQGKQTARQQLVLLIWVW